MDNRKLFVLAGCLCLLGSLVRAQAPVALFTSNVTSGCAPLAVKFQDQSTNNPTSWEWDFGNGQTSNQQNPTAGFGTGTYTVTLIVKNAAGTNAIRQTNYITVYASPIVSIGLDLHLACAPALITFQQFSQPGQGTITSYDWNFGDNTSGGGATPQHLYTSPGYYTVSINVTNSGGCSTTETYPRTLRLVQGVQANFGWSEPGGACTAPFSLNFQNQTAGPGNMSYNWSFGGGAAPTASNAADPGGISYPAAGNYPVTLIAASDLGCADTLTQTVPISSNAPIITGPTAGCINTPITFSNGTNPAPIAQSWDFGDGQPGSNQTNPTHTYTAAGPYTVTLTNTYAGCTTTATSTINIGAALVPAFTAVPASACQAPLSVQFTDQTSPTPTQWTWDFNDGSLPSNLQNPLHTYNRTGAFNVSLTATTAAGCTGTTTLTKVVSITAPTINFVHQGACVGQSWTPNYSVSSVDPVATYSWNAPGANPSTTTGPAPAFVYSATGFYSITLTITTNSGCSATQTFTSAIEVGTAVTPVINYSPNSPICGTAQVNFTSPTPAGEWYWTFNDGTHTDSGQSVFHIFADFGSREVVLQVNEGGCLSSTQTLVTTTPPIPKFHFIVDCATNDPTTPNNLMVSFIDSTLNDVTLSPLTYTWDLGDGTTIGPTPGPFVPPPHTYPGTGVYPITLTVTNGTCTAQAFRTLNLVNIVPNFTVSQNPVCNQQPFTLTSTSTTVPAGLPISDYTWSFGPGSDNRAGSVFTTQMGAVGAYPATLTVTDQNGCQYTSNPTTITVTAPIVNFTAPAGACVNSAATFTDHSTPSALGSALTQYIWDFGDGTGSHNFNGPPFTHQFADTGSYTVIETVVDNYPNGGCSARDTVKNAVLITSPHAIFIEPDSFYCPGTVATFTDLSIGYGLTYNWDFGDGLGGSTQQNPQHTFPATSGVAYIVTEKITDRYGCTTDTAESIKIQSPIAAFTIADTTAICAPLQTMFTSTAQYYDSLYWEFGDGATSTLAPGTSHFYNSLGTFTATLVAQGPGGCRDSTSRNVILTNPTTTVFKFTPQTACDSVVALFTIVPPPYTIFTLNFGDNTSDSSGNEDPVHTYRNPNTLTPYLDLTDATGCIVQINYTSLTVLGAVPFFTATPAAFCDTGTVTFIDYTITNNGILSKTFSWGDGTSTPQPAPLTNPFDTIHYYGTPGFMAVTLNVVTLANCTASFTDTIRVYQTPQPVISDSGYLCAGLIQFLGKLIVPDPDTISWRWDFGNGQTANVQNPLVNAASGTYQIILITSVGIGCADTTSSSITVNPNPTIQGPKKISTPVGVPVTIPFTYSSDVNAWIWNPATNLSCADCANPTATLTFPQTYSVWVTDANNCTDTASILINTICDEENYFLPNTFSPNGDGVNDYFYPRGKGLFNIQSMTIFNRLGQMVFQRKNFPANSETMGWDGTINGKPAPMDAYVYIVEVICNNAQVVPLHGNVTLVR